MSKNKNLKEARRAKKDEFYTQMIDIEKEMTAYVDHDPDVFREKTILLPCDDPEWSNFTKFFTSRFQEYGIEKLISTSFSPDHDRDGEGEDDGRGRILVVDRADDGQVDIEDLRWEYLEGDGDFRSSEVTALRDEADMVITNPPFSLFREFISWIIEGDVKYSVIGNMNAVTYKGVFPMIKDNKMFLGSSVVKEFRIPDSYPIHASKSRTDDEGNDYVSFGSVRWFTNIDHGRVNEPLSLMTMEDNLRSNKRIINHPNSYKTYDNYDAIEVPSTSGIPSDYDGVMGVPISFLDKYDPEQFEIIGITDRQNTSGMRTHKYTADDSPRFNDLNARSVIKQNDGEYKQVYARILIRHKNNNDHDHDHE